MFDSHLGAEVFEEFIPKVRFSLCYNEFRECPLRAYYLRHRIQSLSLRCLRRNPATSLGQKLRKPNSNGTQKWLQFQRKSPQRPESRSRTRPHRRQQRRRRSQNFSHRKNKKDP